jgi:hypothetical protein
MSPAVRRGLREAWKWTLANFDPLLAAVLAATFSVLGILNILEGDALFQAVGALLVVLAITVYRERTERDRAVGRIEAAVRGIQAPKGWEVEDGEFAWRINDLDGKTAEATNRKELTILASEVYSTYEYYDHDGSLGATRYRGGRRGAPMHDLPVMQTDLPGPAGRRYQVVSLYESWRELRNSFTADREYVKVHVEIPTSRLTMTVEGPAVRPPTSLRVDRSGRPSEVVDIASVHTSGATWRYSRTFTEVSVDEIIAFVWEW